MEILNAFFNGYFKQKTTESGRSMVEILGVLAVMGVLSAGGIYGYSFAMDKYRANDIVYEVNLRANDVWHKYQEQPLPDPSEDGTDFDEFPDMTGTGYPIYMTSHPDIAFKTYVEGVSSRVCKNVVNMNLNGIVKGIQFVQVAQGEGDLVKYTGNASICGEDETDNTIVFTSFIDSESQDLNNQHCVEESDCTGLCAPYTCDNNMTCRDKCYTLDDTPHCLDDGEGGKCVECVTNDHCEKGKICNDLNNTCVVPPDTCDIGVSFRSKNGFCIPCTDSGSIIIDENVFEFEELNIKDELTGLEQCEACTNHQIIQNKNGVTYCSVGCVTGVNYQLQSGGCVDCFNADNTKNMQTHRIVYNDPVGIKQCKACDPKRFTYNNGWLTTWCSIDVDCQTNQFKGTQDNGPHCFDCTEKRDSRVWMLSDSSLKMFSSCTSCPERIGSTYTKRYISGSYCYPLCEQPNNAQEQITICSDSPDSDNCTRQWQNEAGECFPCDSKTENNYIGTNETLKTLCLNCGRRINAHNYCLPKKGGCDIGQILNVKGKCVPCTDGWTEIESDEVSGCTNNCKKDETNQYSASGSTQTKWVHQKKNADGVVTKTLCYKICPPQQWQNEFGVCHACNDDDGRYGNEYLDAEHCDNPCKDTVYPRYQYNGRCVGKIPCPDKNNVKYFRNSFGECTSCNNKGLHTPISKEDCLRCNNRIFITEKSYCFPIQPGVAGICNSSEQYVLTDNLDPDLKAYAQKWLDGEYDDHPEKGGGYVQEWYHSGCYRCDETRSVETTLAQCKSCHKRRFADPMCHLGQCENTVEFLNKNYGCTKCENTYNRNISSVYNGKEYLCQSCENRQLMTQKSTGITYCVPNNCSMGFEWQRADNGACQSCTSNNSKQEIGEETIFHQQCEACQRVAFSEIVDNKTIWYCSMKPNRGYFINKNGLSTSCSVSEDIEIVGSTSAKNLCTAEGCNRQVLQDGESFYCIK